MAQQPPHLDLFGLFAHVAEARSFSAAAKELGLSKATISKRVAELEAALGVPLVARTTRRAALTEAGVRVLARAQRMIEEAECAMEEAGEARHSPRGSLKVSAPLTFAILYLRPVLQSFLRAYPDILLDLHLEDRPVDLIGENYDAALRISAMEDSSLIARRLAPVRVSVVGAPAYFAARGRPRRPEDFAAHSCFVYANLAAPIWRFTGPDGERVQVRVEPRLRYNNGDVIECLLRDGLGVALQPDFIYWRDVQEGALEIVLPEWRAPDLQLHLLTAPGPAQTRRLKAWSDFLHDHFGAGRAPWRVNAPAALQP